MFAKHRDDQRYAANQLSRESASPATNSEQIVSQHWFPSDLWRRHQRRVLLVSVWSGCQRLHQDCRNFHHQRYRLEFQQLQESLPSEAAAAVAAEILADRPAGQAALQYGCTKGHLPLRELVSRVYPFAEFPAAVEAARGGDVVKVQVEVGSA